MTLKVVKLANFLEGNNVGNSPMPALVHTTYAKNIYDIAEHMKLRVFDCNVFHGEKLCYLFIGRPAYKWSSESEASYWQCPLVFVLNGISTLKPKRIYPFDSGAFVKRIFPEYITLFPIEHFNLGSDMSLVNSIIGIFYGDSLSYMKGGSKSETMISEHVMLTPRHQEIQALIRLYNDRTSGNIDDRSRAIEVQFDSDISLVDNELIGIIYPDAYESDKELMGALSILNCQLKSYHIYPLRVENYYQAIYEHAREMQTSSGIIRR
jgi:hypothetical protein